MLVLLHSIADTYLLDSWKSSSWSTGRSGPTSAGNATLGFQTIQVINLPTRFDRADALVLQSRVSGLGIEITPGVDKSGLKDNVGMPPNSAPGGLKDSEKACFRAHANLWQRMLNEKWSSLLIMEADAAWDVNIRSIMQLTSHAMNKLMDAYPQTSSKSKASEHDPWNMSKWDYLSLGYCWEAKLNSNESLVFSDPNAPSDMSYYGRKLVDERVVRRSGGTICTTAYALSPQGAMKLLTKFSIDNWKPIDLAMKSTIVANELIAYSVYPTPVTQWIYRDGSGAESGNTDIGNIKNKKPGENKEVWKDIHQTMNVWSLKPNHRDAKFKNGALQALKGLAFEDGRT